MDDYMQLKCVFPAAHDKADIVTAFLAELGFDMFDKYSHGGCSCFGSTFSQKVAQKVG